MPSSMLSIESDIAYNIPTSARTLTTPTNLANAPNDLSSLPFCAVRPPVVNVRGVLSADVT